MARQLALVAVAVLLAAFVPAAARADGDPASDYLLGQNVFLPFRVVVPAESKAQLLAIVNECWKRGYKLRVAVIGDQYDLGSVPSLFDKPHEYAQFLGQELVFVYKGTLLVVMPSGYGVSLRGRTLRVEERRLAALPSPAAAKTDVTTAAIRAVQRLAADRGIQLGVPQTPAPKSTRSSDRLKIILAAVVAACAVGGVVAARRRAKPS